MVNREVASQINLLAALMELHGENPFKTKTYQRAYQSLRKWDRPLAEMSLEEIEAIQGVSAAAAIKIKELATQGMLPALEKLKEKTPVGIQQLLSIKGMGPKRIRTIWDALGVETPAELLYACQENRLVKLPGFGLKTQEDLCAKITYFLDSMHRYLFGVIEADLTRFEKLWEKNFPNTVFTWVGEYARKSPVISSIECIITPAMDLSEIDKLAGAELIEENGNVFSIMFEERYAIRCTMVPEKDHLLHVSRMTMSEPLFERLRPVIQSKDLKSIHILLRENGYDKLPPELLDFEGIEEKDPDFWTDLVTDQDLKGIVHNHSTYSDGIHTLEEMAVHVRDAGYKYFGICDHSQSAFYANGLSPERVLEQLEEIDRLNAKLAPFVILKGIESDILNDGSLDYHDDLLSKFELVVASVHSNLRMDEEKATARLIKAIENPYTQILGHPTSRLLLARPGYPINYKKVIDACAANKVVIELNANPQRMEMDHEWLPYCQEKGVWISINPDAHSRSQLSYLKYGVMTARKGALKKHNCLNALELEDFLRVVNRKKESL